MFATEEEADKFIDSFNEYNFLGALAKGYSVTLKKNKEKKGKNGFAVEMKKTLDYSSRGQRKHTAKQLRGRS